MLHWPVRQPCHLTTVTEKPLVPLLNSDDFEARLNFAFQVFLCTQD